MLFNSWIASRQDLFDVLTEPAFALTVLTVKPLETQDFHPYGNGIYYLPEERRMVLTKIILDYEDRQLQRANAITKRVYEGRSIRSISFIFLSWISALIMSCGFVIT